jgi:hypothetical protein
LGWEVSEGNDSLRLSLSPASATKCRLLAAWANNLQVNPDTLGNAHAILKYLKLVIFEIL